MAAPLVTAAIAVLSGMGPQLHAAVAAGPGILSGAIWNAGNICSIVATRDPRVGLAIAYPIMQVCTCQHVHAGVHMSASTGQH